MNHKIKYHEHTLSLPVIDADVVAEMNDTLTNTGWLTSGPKVVALELPLQRDWGVCPNP
jgi:hypothetical protein